MCTTCRQADGLYLIGLDTCDDGQLLLQQADLEIVLEYQIGLARLLHKKLDVSKHAILSILLLEGRVWFLLQQGCVSARRRCLGFPE